MSFCTTKTSNESRKQNIHLEINILILILFFFSIKISFYEDTKEHIHASYSNVEV